MAIRPTKANRSWNDSACFRLDLCLAEERQLIGSVSSMCAFLERIASHTSYVFSDCPLKDHCSDRQLSALQGSSLAAFKVFAKGTLCAPSSGEFVHHSCCFDRPNI